MPLGESVKLILTEFRKTMSEDEIEKKKYKWVQIMMMVKF